MSPEEELELIEIELELARKGKRGTPAPEAPAEPSMWEKAREGVKGAARSVADLANAANQTQIDAGSAALRGASLGLDDEIARLAARAGATVQRQREADDQMLSGGGESLLESWRATEGLGDEALQERRGEVEAAKKRSPIAAGGAEIGASLATGMAAPGAQGARLAQIASGAGVGAVAGAGMGDAEGEDMAADALMGGAVGGAAGAAVPAASAFLRRAGGVLRPRGVPSAPAPALVSRAQAADVAQAVANEGPYGAARKFLVGKVAEKIRGAKPAAPVAGRPEWMAGLTDDVGAAADDASGLELGRVLRPKQKPLPEFDVDVVDDLEPIAVQADDIVDEVATASPPLQPDDVLVTPQRAPQAPVPPPPQPSRGAGGEVLTDLRRATLGRRATQTEIRDAIEEVAIREGTTDIATLSNKIGVPTTQLRDVLTPMVRDAQFRARVAAGGVRTTPASSAIDEQAAAGRIIRESKASARSPIDNVSGRSAGQVAAVHQQEKWRAAYDNLPTEQRANFVDMLRRETGLADDTIRQRLKMTKAEWRRTSFERSKAASPVLRPKVEAAPATSTPEPAPAPAASVLRAKAPAVEESGGSWLDPSTSLRTYRIGSQKGSSGTFFGSGIKDMEGARLKRWSRDLPKSGDDVMVVSSAKHAGDASDAPLASAAFDGDIVVSSDLKEVLDMARNQGAKYETLGSWDWRATDLGDAVGALSAKRAGKNVVHLVKPGTDKAVSVDLREHSIEELENAVRTAAEKYRAWVAKDAAKLSAAE